MALEYAKVLGQPNPDPANGANPDIPLDGGTIVVPALGIAIAFTAKYWEIKHLGVDAANAATAVDLMVRAGVTLTDVTMPDVGVPADNTNAAKLGSKEVPAGEYIMQRPNKGMWNVMLIPRSGTIRVRLTPGSSFIE